MIFWENHQCYVAGQLSSVRRAVVNTRVGKWCVCPQHQFTNSTTVQLTCWEHVLTFLGHATITPTRKRSSACLLWRLSSWWFSWDPRDQWTTDARAMLVISSTLYPSLPLQQTSSELAYDDCRQAKNEHHQNCPMLCYIHLYYSRSW